MFIQHPYIAIKSNFYCIIYQMRSNNIDIFLVGATLVGMDDDAEQKRKNLQANGLLNPAPERILAPLFTEHSQFFDAHDHLQVRYEMLRAHEVDHASVVDICNRYGTSRQTFYNLQEKFLKEGTAGLLAKKTGPKGPTKLTPDVVAYIEEQLEQDGGTGTPQLLSRIQRRFGLSLHRRTIEKVVQARRIKKNA